MTPEEQEKLNDAVYEEAVSISKKILDTNLGVNQISLCLAGLMIYTVLAQQNKITKSDFIEQASEYYDHFKDYNDEVSSTEIKE